MPPTPLTQERKGDYGTDGSFRTASATTQGAAVSAASAALLIWAGVSLARGRRLRAALAAASS
ncbi:MAG TPA: SAM-dependent methyltransferase, partial [Mycobacterium sp.]|nr:SAM-dependent methyltransferase [Mycobacterium sp.]